MLERNVIANKTLEFQHVTVFAPTNEAFQGYKSSDEETDANLVLYHMSKYKF